MRSILLSRFVLITVILAAKSAVSASAQSSYVPTAPKPALLSSAKTAFLSNNTAAPLADSDKIFDEFDASVRQTHRFSLVPDPASADIVLELSLRNENTTQVFTITLIDPKTHIVLWSVSDAGEAKAIYGPHGKKNEHDVIDALVDYLIVITANASYGAVK